MGIALKTGLREKAAMSGMGMDFAKTYLEGLKQSVEALPLNALSRIASLIWEAYQSNRQIFVIGNGGSAATAAHFACDLAKGTITEGKKRFRVLALTDNIPVITAWSNDFGYDRVFVEQLKNLLQPGDLVIGLSGSGNSKNVLFAMDYARASSANTIGICGLGGGMMPRLADECLIVDSTDMQQVEDIHLIITHIMSRFLRLCVEQGFQGAGPQWKG